MYQLRYTVTSKMVPINVGNGQLVHSLRENDNVANAIAKSLTFEHGDNVSLTGCICQIP